jgi:hypothetical protein
MAFLNPLVGLRQFMAGLGYVPNPGGGNEANAPADPPVQTGDYQFIQETMYGPADARNSTGDDQSIVNIPTVPPAYLEWDGTTQLGEFGLSGLEGGGITGDVPDQWGQQGNVLYYDPTSGLYIDLGQNQP